MDKAINPQTRSYYADDRIIDHLQNAVYLRLTTPKGSYWADSEFGSLLHTIQREKDVERVYQLAEQYASEALQPIIDDGRAASIAVKAIKKSTGFMQLLIDVISNAQQQQFKHDLRVI